MIDVTASGETEDDARARANVVRLAAAQALTGANSAVIFATRVYAVAKSFCTARSSDRWSRKPW